MSRGMDGLSDEPVASDLSELLGPGGDAAARELAETVRVLVSRFSARHPLARREGEDVVQDVLGTCLEQARKIAAGRAEPLRSRDAWLCRVTHNAVLGLYRKSKGAERELTDREAELPAPRPISIEERLGLRKALAALDQTCRDLLVRREVLGESRQRMAEALGLDGNTLGVRLHRCRKRLLSLYLGEAVA